MNRRWIRMAAVAASLVLGGAAMSGCEVDDDALDGTGSAGTADTAGGGEGGADTGSGGEGGATECGDLGCVLDGYCCPECTNGSGTPTDPDCNPVTPQNSNTSKKNPQCSCDYWGFVCEASKKCSTKACDCDPDCTLPDGDFFDACQPDQHCDTWCTENGDPDCASGSADNGKYCGSNDTCDQKVNNCDAAKGSTNDCSDDPDCDGIDQACEADGWCDSKCSAGADPDC